MLYSTQFFGYALLPLTCMVSYIVAVKKEGFLKQGWFWFLVFCSVLHFWSLTHCLRFFNVNTCCSAARTATTTRNGCDDVV